MRYDLAFGSLTVSGQDDVVGSLVVAGSIGEATGSLTVDAFVSDASLPSRVTGGPVPVEAGMEVWIGGTKLDHSRVHSVSVTRSRRSHVQQWSFEVDLDHTGDSPIGNPWTEYGPAECLQEVDIYGVYRKHTDGSVYRVPLIKRGIADNVQRTVTGRGRAEAHNGLDAAARIQRQSVTRTFPPGHGIKTDRMAQLILSDAGETSFDFEPGRRRDKEMQLVDADPLSSTQELFSVEGRLLWWNRDGSAVNKRIRPGDGASAILTITAADLAGDASVTSTHLADVVTQVTATGSEQVTGEATTEPCGLVTEPPDKSESFRTFAPLVATYEQTDPDGTLTSLGLTPPTEKLQLHTLFVRLLTHYCGVPIVEESRVYRFFNPETPRYYWNQSATPDPKWDARDLSDGPYLYNGATANGNEPAYAWKREKWQLVSVVKTRHHYDTPQFIYNGDQLTPTGDELAPLRGSYSTLDWTGRYLGSITEEKGWRHIRTSIKDRGSFATPFEELDPKNGVLRLGGGETVTGTAEFRTVRQTYELVESEEDTGKIRTSHTYTQGYTVVSDGSQYQFTDGQLSGSEDETYEITTIETERYVDEGEDAHRVYRFRSGLNIEDEADKPFRQPGARASVSYLPGYEPYDDTADLGAGDLEDAVRADPTESRGIKVVVSAPTLETCHLPRHVKTDFPYAEDEDELYAAAEDIIADSLKVTLPITPCSVLFALAEGDLVNLNLPPIFGDTANHLGVVDSISWSVTDGGVPDTSLTVDVYPDGI